MSMLAIECTHASLSVAVMIEGREVVEIVNEEWMKAAETLLPLIEQAMAKSEICLQKLDSIAISSGPGSFTALRIGMSVAKGMAYGLGIPLIPVPTMPAMAASLPIDAGMVIAVIPAQKGAYYYAAYTQDELFSGTYHNEVYRGAANDIVMAATSAPEQSGRVVVVGRGLEELRFLLSATCAHYANADFFTAKSLFPSAERMYSRTDMRLLDRLVPDYWQTFVPKVGRT
ncbi:MAG: tRNA (adenosine(37)-N6)-threonylcarbamoyltransferase complex dimerization subunit type 1 TsaB [Chlorobiaceae bacterium]